MPTKLVNDIAHAIAKMEGFFKANSLSQRNYNPGNLRSWGKTPVVDGYAKFATPEAGWVALYKQIEKNIKRKLTLIEFFAGKPGVYAGYAPAADKNKPQEYAQFVAGRVGISPTVPLDTITLA